MNIFDHSILMGTIELQERELRIISHIITYGHASSEAITNQMRDEIETMWNEPAASLKIGELTFPVRFTITASHRPALDEMEIVSNTDPRNNYFRIEEFAMGNISFVDGLGCNTGYFKLENLYKGSTTAAHEYGHTLGLDHPSNLDLRGKGVPGIMYPRGTLVDPQYQYEPDKPAGSKGGTMHPMYRKVLAEDVYKLNLVKLISKHGSGIIGDFTNVWHPDHREL
jgi:hypothetical protein